MDQTLRKSNKSIQILLSICAFSLLFSCFPIFPLLCHYFSNFSFQIFSYTTDRNYIFLFCNGILAFLIRNSVLASENQPQVPESSEKIAVAREEAVGVEQETERGNENLVAEEGKENEILTTQQQQQQQQQQQDEEKEGEFVIFEEDDFFEEEGMELLSTEELNKKCDEFIRKMREGIKFEAFLVFDSKKTSHQSV